MKAIEEAMLRDQRVFLVTQKDVQVEIRDRMISTVSEPSHR